MQRVLGLGVRANFNNAPASGRASPGGEGGEEGGGDAGSLVVARLMGGVEYGRPLATGWTGTLGVNWQRAKCLDEHGKALTQVPSPAWLYAEELSQGPAVLNILHCPVLHIYCGAGCTHAGYIKAKVLL